MKYEIKWQKKATKQLFKLPPDDQRRIVGAVGKLSDSATWTNVRALVNHQYSHRLRVGNFRVLFDADCSPGAPEEIRVLDIVEVRRRNEGTY